MKNIKLHINGYKSLLKIICLLMIICFAFGITQTVQGKSQFDSDDEELVFEEEETTALFNSGQSNSKSFLNDFLNDSTFTFGYLFSHGTDVESKIIDNMFYIDLEYETLFAQNIFFKFDGKSSFHAQNDHRAKAKNRDLFVDGNIREMFIQTGYEKFSLKIGQQTTVWGKADTAAITDVVSPRDNSQFIFTRLEDARLGQIMLSGNYYLSDMNTFIFFSPLPETDREPDRDTRYYRSVPGSESYLIKKDSPEFGDLEYGFKIDKTISKTDFSILAGHFFSNAALYNFKGYFENLKPVVEKTYPDYIMGGAAIVHAWQSCLFKLELAYKNDFPLQGINSNNIYIIKKSDVLDSAFGIEYNANDKYRMSFEISNRYIFSSISKLLPGINKNFSAFYYTFTKDFLNETLNFEYMFYYHIQEQNSFHHFRLTYDFTDNIELEAGYACFNAKDKNSFMWLYRNEDRVSIEIRYLF